jgi:hypothetical protein
MPITPDDFDRQPPAAPEPPMTSTGIPIYQPPVRVSPAAPAKGGTPGWVKLLIILAILFVAFKLSSNGVQEREVPTNDTAVTSFDTTATRHDGHGDVDYASRPAVEWIAVAPSTIRSRRRKDPQVRLAND